jgi:hypothetical protein
MLLSKTKTVFAFLLIACAALFAQTNNETSDFNNEAIELSTIEVKATITSAQKSSLIDSEKIASTPTPTNSITDTLRSNSNIQFSSNSRSSAKGGEIAPPKVSIRGSQHYENNFMINGVSNNNNLNPSGINEGSAWDKTAGEAQSLFIDTNLVENIEAHTENIGAEYGGFTGGVVDAKLKDARMDRWHVMTNFRYTKDSFAKYHLTDEQKQINQSDSVDFQPEFNKYEYSLSLDGPLNDNLGLLLSYGKQRSKIPLWSTYYYVKPDGSFSHKERRIQYRDNDNFLVKLNTHGIDDLEASLTAIYAPYAAAMYFPEGPNSDFDQKGGGLNIAYEMKNALSFGVLKNTIAYKQDKFAADGDTNYYYMWKNTTGYANWFHPQGWGSREGYTGDQKFVGDVVIYKGVLELDEIETGLATHLIKTGLEAEFGKAKYKRDEAYYYYNTTLNSSVTGKKDDGIIDGEQWAGTLYLYEGVDNKKSYTTAALFLEDEIKLDGITIRPGVRISTDSVTDNTDIAPRLFANADMLETINVYGGYNRYYGGLLLYNAVYQRDYTSYSRAAANAPWVEGGRYGRNSYSLDGIKTPYSDEFNIGASLDKWDVLFKLDFVKREYKDQLKQKQENVGVNINKIKNTNEGKSSYWGLSLGASKEYKLGNTKHFSEVSLTKSDASTNLNGLNSFASADTYSATHVTYDGKLTKYEDVPSPNFNSPIIITYSHIAQLSGGLKLGINARYEKGVDGYKFVSNSGGKTDPEGIETKVYESKHYGDTFTVDLSANYDLKLKGDKLTFRLEVLNLLNRKNDASYTAGDSNIDGYAMGRQFYANVRYEY